MIFAPNDGPTNPALGGVVVERNTSVAEEACEIRPVIEGVPRRRAEARRGEDFATVIVPPSARGGFIAPAPAEHQMHSYYATVTLESFEDGVLVGHIDGAEFPGQTSTVLTNIRFRVATPSPH